MSDRAASSPAANPSLAGVHRWLTQPSLYGGLVGTVLAVLYGILTLDLPRDTLGFFLTSAVVILAIFSAGGDWVEQAGLRKIKALAETAAPPGELLRGAVREAAGIPTRSFFVNVGAFGLGSALIGLFFWFLSRDGALALRIGAIGTMFGPSVSLLIYLMIVNRSRDAITRIAALGLTASEVIEAHPATSFRLERKLMLFTAITAVTPTVLIADVTLGMAERLFVRELPIELPHVIAIALLGLMVTALVIGAAWIAGSAMSRPLVEMEAAAARLSSGDLRTQAVIPAEEEAWAASAAFSTMQLRLSTMLAELQRTGIKVASSAEQLVSAASQHESGTLQQVPALHETSATTEELARSAKQIAENATEVANIAERTLGASQQGQQGALAFAEAMSRLRRDSQGIADSVVKLNKRVQQVGKVVQFINEIADKSDLLALNAELEGTKAGDVGRGFSLVASEMRRLAENVISSTQEIQGLIVEIRDGTQTAVMATESGLKATDAGAALSTRVSESLQKIYKLAAETSEAVRAISMATQQQQTGTDQLAQAMADILRVTHDGANATRKMSATNQSLGKLSKDLKQVVERFQV